MGISGSLRKVTHFFVLWLPLSCVGFRRGVPPAWPKIFNECAFVSVFSSFLEYLFWDVQPFSPFLPFEFLKGTVFLFPPLLTKRLPLPLHSPPQFSSVPTCQTTPPPNHQSVPTLPCHRAYHKAFFTLLFHSSFPITFFPIISKKKSIRRPHFSFSSIGLYKLFSTEACRNGPTSSWKFFASSFEGWFEIDIIYCANCISVTGLFLFSGGVCWNSMCFRAGFRWMCLKHNVSTSATNSRQLDMRFKHKVSIRFPGANNAASHVESTQSHARSQRPRAVTAQSTWCYTRSTCCYTQTMCCFT